MIVAVPKHSLAMKCTTIFLLAFFALLTFFADTGTAMPRDHPSGHAPVVIDEMSRFGCVVSPPPKSLCFLLTAKNMTEPR